METNILQKTGKNLDYLSLEKIKEKHEKAVNYQPLVFETKLSSIELQNSNSMYLDINGKTSELEITDIAYEDFININNFNKKTTKTFTKIFKDGDKTIELLNNFKNEYIRNQGDKNVVVVGDKHTKQIVSMFVKDKHYELVTNNDFLKTVYRVVNQNNLKITDFDVDNFGQISINTIVDDGKTVMIGDLDSKFGIPENETFRRGFHFMNDVTSSKIFPSTIRIICSNQITTSQADEAIMFKNLRVQTLNSVNKYFKNYEKIDYLPKSFKRQVTRAFSTPASLQEYEHVTNTILNNTNIDKASINEYINYDQLNDTFNYYTEKNNIVLSTGFKKQIPIDKTVWELINTMTYIGSNAPNSQVTEGQRKKLFVESGRVLRGDYKSGMFDLQLRYGTPYSKKWI